MNIQECFDLLKSKPTDSFDEIKKNYHIALLENRDNHNALQELREVYNKLENFINNGFLYGCYSFEEYLDGINCRCGSKFEGSNEIIECDSCSYYIILNYN
ncbi:hypothetical protein TUBRATIS_11710 [Tubulinosema ratisbonensis]|uniref:Uncharacterized protein n=1 Tax=Tubulinosema ratisbonensis TaxID=291195 RepID=A0A437AML4_9MICR|nr:hypothetical protein TUBRATIS_11710 [Tubulinosema ratisbonensis]